MHTLWFLSLATYHEYLLIPLPDRMVIDHANDGNAQVTPDAKGDAEAQARQDGDDVAPGQAEAGAVHDRQLFLLHQLRAALR